MSDELLDLVSVIVPFLNGSHWLVEALESVLQQTYKNWELVVINDGSTEMHSAVAKEFCSQHPGKIKYLEHEGRVNKGVSVSRNVAAKAAQGKYLAFLDADDVWKPEKLAQQLQQFKANPQAQAACEAIVQWYTWQNQDVKDYVQLTGAPAGKCYTAGTLQKILYPLNKQNSPAPSGIMIRKTAFERIGGFEPAFSGIFELYEDQAFLSKLYLNEAVYISGSANVMYRQREGSMSSAANNPERYKTVRNYYFDWLEQYLSTHKIVDPELNFLIKKCRNEIAIVSETSDEQQAAITAL